MPNEGVSVNTLVEESPVLREAGVERKFEKGEVSSSWQDDLL